MLKCRELAEQASEYIDGQLTLRQRLAVLMHLLMCGKCRTFVRHLRLTIAYCRHLPQAGLDTGEAERIARSAIEASAREH